MKPLSPIKPQDQLPLTYHLTIVKEPSKGSHVLAVVGSVIQGSEVISKKVFGFFEDKQEAMDEMNRRGTRCWYFDDPSDWETL